MVDPPLEVGAVNAIDADALPAVAVPIVGAPGTDDVLPELVSSPPHPAKLKRIVLNASILTPLTLRCADMIAAPFTKSWMTAQTECKMWMQCGDMCYAQK